MNKRIMIMQKEQNVIKWILIMWIFSLSSQLYCQEEIIGRYTNLISYQEHYNYFNFNENGVFEYHSGASLGDDEFGKGHYLIKNDSLILNYDLTEPSFKSYHKIKEYYNSKGSISIKIVVKDFKNNPIINAETYILKENKGYIVNSNGKAIFDLKKEDKNFVLGVSDVGYESYNIKLSKLKNYIIEVFLKQGSNAPKAIKGEILKYKLIEYNNSFIKIKKKNKVLKLIKQ